MLNTSGVKRRQIYLTTFPVGALFVIVFIIVVREKLNFFSEVVGMGSATLILLGSLVLYFQPLKVYTIETSFYFFMALFLPALAGALLTNPNTILNMSSALFAETINGLTLWVSIIFMGAFLSISPRAFKLLVILVFLVIFLIYVISAVALLQVYKWNFTYLFHFLHSFFALGITMLLISRIGRIQQLHATTDKLTGLLNRYAGSAKLSEEFEYGAGNSTDLAVILVDVDHFKEINDFHGHLVGDKVLKEFGDVISNFIRKTDSVVRWGGEEFLVILPNTTIENGVRLAERLREEIDQRVFATQLHVTASFGVASRQHGQDMEALFHAADQAMYKAKEGGRNQVIVYTFDSSSK